MKHGLQFLFQLIRGARMLHLFFRALLWTSLGTLNMASTYVDTSSTRYVVPSRDERATGTISRPTTVRRDEVVPPPPQRAPRVAATPAPTPRRKSFSFTQNTYLSHGPAKVWDGCDRDALVTGGKGSNSSCDQDYMHPRFAAHMEKHFFACVQDSAARAGMPRPARVHLNHAGCYQNRNVSGSSLTSLHAHARAIDIYNFNMYDSQGNLTRVSANISKYRGPNKTFYDAFRRCWRNSLPSRCRDGYQREGSGSIGIVGSEMGGNRAHNDHIHLTFPPCGG